MNQRDFIERAESFFGECKSRLEGVGADQYYDVETETQKFETMPMSELYEYAREEAYDIANYALMLAIRIDQLEQRLKDGIHVDSCEEGVA